MKNHNLPKTQHYPKQLDVFEAWLLKNKGIRDSRLRALRQAESEEGLAPQIRKEVAAYSEFTEKEWLRCEIVTAELHIIAEQIYQELELAKSRFLDFSTDRKYPGEDDITPSIIRQRRMKELSPIDKASSRLNEIKAQIAEIENVTRFNCERAQCYVAGRIAAYLIGYRIGCMQSNPNAELLPTPPALLSSGEDTYLSQHRWSFNPKAAINLQEGGYE